MMQDEVNKIVFNALADGREIWFPGVGSLVPEFRSAWRASARQLERPSRRIAFLLSEQRGVSVIDLIARAGACDVAAAEDIYSRWLDKARVEDGISIPGVGELNHRYFRLDSQLDAVLNPLGHDPLPLKRRYSRLPLYLGIALFCTAAVGYGIWQYGEWMRLPFVGDSEKQEVLPVAEVVSSVPARTGSGTPEATGGDAESGAIDFEPVAESRPVETSQDDEAAGVGLCLPAAHLCVLGLQLAGSHAVLVGEVGAGQIRVKVHRAGPLQGGNRLAEDLQRCAFDQFVRGGCGFEAQRRIDRP